jgi:hypothetical protein
VHDSDAFKDLSNCATRILVLLLRKRDIRNGGKISLGVREAAAWAHCSDMTACRALKELQNAGLITLLH